MSFQQQKTIVSEKIVVKTSELFLSAWIMDEFDAIYRDVEDLEQSEIPESAEHEPIIIRGVGEVTM